MKTVAFKQSVCVCMREMGLWSWKEADLQEQTRKQDVLAKSFALRVKKWKIAE